MLRNSKAFAGILLANVIASIAHFGDNMLRFSEYPEPAWITSPRVVGGLWLVMTSLLAVGWWLGKRERKWAALGALWLYAGLSLFALGHYWYAHPTALPPRINGLIALEAVSAGLLLVAAPFALRGHRATPEPQPPRGL